MINSMTSLSLQPLTTFPEGQNRRTTITSFEDMLKEQKLSAKAEEQEEAGTAVEEKASSEEAVEEQGVVYCNPSTGEQVRYVDVSNQKEDNTEVEAAAKKTETSTTTASSMKKTKYDSYFKKAALKYNVSESLLKAIAKAESNFNAKSVSSAGAMGVMQLMPVTAESLGVDDPYDPEQNIMGGAKCISMKLKEFKGDVKLALAAYNAGSGAVKRYGGVPSYCKTYVNRVLSYKEAFETASAVG